MPGTQFAMAPCGCCSKPGLCVYVTCCPCFAFNEAASNIGDDKGVVYCLAYFPCGLGCCALGVLGNEVAKQQGIDMTLPKSCCCAFFDPCLCYSCTVVNESRVIKKAPITAVMNRTLKPILR